MTSMSCTNVSSHKPTHIYILHEVCWQSVQSEYQDTRIHTHTHCREKKINYPPVISSLALPQNQLSISMCSCLRHTHSRCLSNYFRLLVPRLRVRKLMVSSRKSEQSCWCTTAFIRGREMEGQRRKKKNYIY